MEHIKTTIESGFGYDYFRARALKDLMRCCNIRMQEATEEENTAKYSEHFKRKKSYCSKLNKIISKNNIVSKVYTDLCGAYDKDPSIDVAKKFEEAHKKEIEKKYQEEIKSAKTIARLKYINQCIIKKDLDKSLLEAIKDRKEELKSEDRKKELESGEA